MLSAVWHHFSAVLILFLKAVTSYVWKSGKSVKSPFFVLSLFSRFSQLTFGPRKKHDSEIRKLVCKLRKGRYYPLLYTMKFTRLVVYPYGWPAHCSSHYIRDRLIAVCVGFSISSCVRFTHTHKNWSSKFLIIHYFDAKFSSQDSQILNPRK